ncbi:arylsulfatase, partial [Candidatus Poribacteria bacterium]
PERLLGTLTSTRVLSCPFNIRESWATGECDKVKLYYERNTHWRRAMGNEKAAENIAGRPNIIVILVDDMGFSDIGCYGAEIQTPNLDRLAENGMRFSQMYNCARCCPTRASLLTGIYPHQAGVGLMVGNAGTPAYQGYLRDDCVSIAEVLRSQGYRTLMSGKWHVGGPYAVDKPETWQRAGDEGHPTPLQRGFDRYYGTLTGAGSYFKPPTLMDQDAFVEPEGDIYYFTDAVSDNAVQMIEECADDDAPFFLYTAYTAPHWPLHALPEDIARYKGKYRVGWDKIRTQRHEELKGSGLLNRKWDISPRDEKAPPWEDAKLKDWEDLRMAVYAAQIDRMDQGVGKIVNKIRDLGMEDNTIIMFLADNGGCAEFLREEGKSGTWPEHYSIPTRDGRPVYVGNKPGLEPGPDDTFMSYDLPWANASNSPFRLYKHWVHEGGIATPFIVHWPAAVGSGIVHEACHVIDIMATCLEASGIAYPSEFNGQEITPMEGESLVPLLRGNTWTRERPIFWEHHGNSAVRMDEWKLVRKHPTDWELYNMTADRTELSDLIQKNQSKVEELSAEYVEWAARYGVRDWPLSKG